MDKINIKTSTNNYDIFIEDDALSRLGELIKTKSVIVIDTKVYSLWKDYIDSTLDKTKIHYNIVTVDGGEINKNIDNVLYMYREFNRYGITKSDKIVCIGGGVVGDMTAFAAATYLRGVDIIQVPTTLLSMVDSSIGGKSAIDMDFGKNLVGVIKAPYAVLIDKRFLGTLDARQRACGMAEILKSGLIGDKMILDEADKEDADISRLIYLSLMVKGGVVMRDEFERGERMVLNLGHTVAHAIEALGKYVKYNHGEAVAIGTDIALRLSEEVLGLDKSVREHIDRLFARYYLPCVDEYSVDEEIEYIARDKKMRDNVINFVLIEKVERPIIKKFTLDELSRLMRKVRS